MFGTVRRAHRAGLLPARRAVQIALTLAAAATAPAGIVWFDPTLGGSRSRTFADVAGEYAQFVGSADAVIGLGGLAEGTRLADQFSASDGVRFANTAGGRYDAYSGVRWESGSIVEHLTGYDGSYRPDRDAVYVKFDNNSAASPFTILFDAPVSMAAAFLGMGVEGSVHSVTVSAYDAADALLGAVTLQADLWESVTRYQNYETFFALRSAAANISRIEILNNATTDFANALVFDQLAYSRSVPEAASFALLSLGAAIWAFGARVRA